MSDTRTPAKPDSQTRPPLPPRPKSALKNRIIPSTPQPTHKRTKSDPSPSPNKKQQEKRVRIDALSPAKKEPVQELKPGLLSSFLLPSPRTPKKPNNVRSKIANRLLSFSGRVAALVVAYDAYKLDPSPANLKQYEEEVVAFGFSCPQNPIRKEEGDEEWQKRLEQHQEEISGYSEYYLLHSRMLKDAKQKNIEQKHQGEPSSPLPQKVLADQVTEKPLSPAAIIPQQASQQRSPVITSPVITLPEPKAQSNNQFFSNSPQPVVTTSIPTHSLVKTKKSSGGFWSCCPFSKSEKDEVDDMRYSQLPGEPVAKQKK